MQRLPVRLRRILKGKAMIHSLPNKDTCNEGAPSRHFSYRVNEIACWIICLQL